VRGTSLHAGKWGATVVRWSVLAVETLIGFELHARAERLYNKKMLESVKARYTSPHPGPTPHPHPHSDERPSNAMHSAHTRLASPVDVCTRRCIQLSVTASLSPPYAARFTTYAP
jgi:hypothetical protein